MSSFRVLRAVLVIATLIACATPALAQETLFTETFDNPTLSRWEHSPNATVVDGALHIGPDGFAFHPARWGDMSFAVRVRSLGEGELLIRYRWSEDANYSVRLRPDLVTVQKQLLGPPEDLDDAPASIPPGEWVEVTVTVDGDWHHVMVNGSPVLIATDPDPLPEGGIGFLVEGEAVGEFDNLEVIAAGQAPPPAEPTPLREPTPAPEPQPTRAPEAAPTPAGRGGICPGAAALPLALMGLVWLSGRRR